MSDDRLNLIASVEDRFSGPLAKMRNALAETTKVPGLANLRKDFAEFEGTVNRLRQTATGLNAVGGLGGMLGLGGIGSVASIAGIAASMRDLARTQVEMRHFSRETGIAAGHLRELQSLGRKFQIEPEAMTGAASRFADHMTDIRRGLGSVYGEIRQKAPQLAKDLRESTSNFEALGKALGWLEKQDANPVDQRRWADALGLGGMERLFTDGPGALRRAWKEVQDSGIGKDSPDLDRQAKALVEATERFDRAMDNMKRTIGPTVLGEMVNVLTRLGEQFERFVRAGQAWREGRYLDALSQADRGKNWNEDRGTPAWEGKPEMAPSGPLGPGKPGADIERRLAEARKAMAEFYGGKNQTAEREKELRDEVRRLTEELKRIREGGATVQQQSFGGPAGFRDLIQKAGWGSGGLGGGMSGLGGSFGGGGGGYSGGGHGGGGSGGGGAGSGSGGGAGQFTSAPPEAAGRYRPQRSLTDRDLSDGVVRTIAGEARMSSREGIDAVINNMFNRLGTRSWGPSRDLQDVAFARGQYAGAGRGRPSAAQAEYIRERIRAIASGGVPDNTGGANSFRSDWYRGRWWQRIGRFGKNVGGNIFGFEPKAPNGPYAPYKTPKDGEPAVAGSGSGDMAEFRAWRERMAREGEAPLEEEDDARVFGQWQQRRKGSLLKGAQRAGVIGGGSDGTLNGKVDVTLTLPPGVEAKTAKEGIVSAVKLNRGSSMAASRSE